MSNLASFRAALHKTIASTGADISSPVGYVDLLESTPGVSPSIDLSTGALLAWTGRDNTQAIDWHNRLLMGWDGAYAWASVDWQTMQLRQQDGVGGNLTVLDWSNPTYLYSAVGMEAAYFNAANGYTTQGAASYHPQGISTPSLQWSPDGGSGYYFRLDTLGLYDPGGVVMDFGSKTLHNSSAVAVINWLDVSATGTVRMDRIADMTGGSLHIDLTSAALMNGYTPVLSWNLNQLYAAVDGSVSADWEQRLLKVTSGSNSVDWQNRQLIGAYDAMTLDWSGTGASAVVLGGGLSSDYVQGLGPTDPFVDLMSGGARLCDATGAATLDWGSRTLIDSLNNTQFDWEAGILGGVTTSKRIHINLSQIQAYNGVDFTTLLDYNDSNGLALKVRQVEEYVYDVGDSSTSVTLDTVNGTMQKTTMTGNCTFTMPAAAAGKSFRLMLYTGAGGFTGTFTGVKWPADTAPTLTATASRLDIADFISDGTSWYGAIGQNYTP